MTDRAFLEWLADRLTVIYGESPNVDFVLKLRSIARATEFDRETPNTVPPDDLDIHDPIIRKMIDGMKRAFHRISRSPTETF